MKRVVSILVVVVSIIGIALTLPKEVMAQEEVPDNFPDMKLSTTYPNQVVEIGEPITLKLKLRSVGEDQTIQFGMDTIPEGWNATFRGGGQVIYSVFVEAGPFETIDLRLDPPENPESGEFTFIVVAQREWLGPNLHASSL